MTRQQRRAAERQRIKDLRKASRQDSAPSDARVTANRANAQMSTGPVSVSGKAASSKNSFKHGLYSKQLILAGEDPAELEALRAALRDEHQPQSETESLLVTEMADQHWRIQRARRLEVKFLEEAAPLSHLSAAHRMMASAERGFFKALKTLTELQKARGFVPKKSPSEEVGFVPQNSEAEINGFVPQIELESDAAFAFQAPKPVQSSFQAPGNFELLRS